MNSIKIAFLVYDYTMVGGVERVTALLSKELIEIGYQVPLLLSIDDKNGLPFLEFPETMKVRVLNRNDQKDNLENNLQECLSHNNIDKLIYQGDNMSIALKIQKVLSKTKCKGILHYHGSPYAYLNKAVYWSDILRDPTFLFKKVWSLFQYPFKKRKLEEVIGNADYFITVSEGVKKELHHLFPKSINKIRSIRNMMTFELTSWDDEFFKSKPKVVTYVSRLERKHKNSMHAIKVWQEAQKKLPNWEFQIIGDGRLKRAMQCYVKRNRIKRCVFHGFQSNVDEYLDKSRITILTSDFEGLAMVLLEASSRSNMLISTKSKGGIIDVIPNEKCGSLVPLDKPNEMANALIEAANNDDLLKEKILNNQEYINFAFDKSKILKKWSKLLDMPS